MEKNLRRPIHNTSETSDKVGAVRVCLVLLE